LQYLPGNVWHYGRISAAVKAGVSGSAATLSVLLEPLLMAAAASNGLTRYPVCSTEQPCCPSGIVNARFDYRTHGGSSGFKQGNWFLGRLKLKVTKRHDGGTNPPSASSSAVDASWAGTLSLRPYWESWLLGPVALDLLTC